MAESRLRMFLIRALLVLWSCAAAILLAETVLRVVAPHGGFGSARELPHFRRDTGFAARFCVDPDFGFRPVLGTDLYNAWGTRTNAYPLAKRPGVTRVLFAGDSVTFRGRIIEALRARYGDREYEYWNAGVESFNTVQEARFYRRYNAAVQPDHVVLTFHLNDFETTPVAFADRAGRMVVYAPNFPARELNARLFRTSRLYRLLIGIRKRGNRHIDAVMDETRAALAGMRDILARDGIRFSVIVFPLLKPYAEWEAGDRFSRDAVLGMLRELGVRHCDLLDTSEQAIAEGVTVCETAGDDWHPSAEAAERFAAHLHAGGLLAEEP